MEDHLQAQEQTPAQPSTPTDPKPSVEMSGAATASAAGSTAAIASPDNPNATKGARSGSDRVETEPIAPESFGSPRGPGGDRGAFGPGGLEAGRDGTGDETHGDADADDA